MPMKRNAAAIASTLVVACTQVDHPAGYRGLIYSLNDAGLSGAHIPAGDTRQADDVRNYGVAGDTSKSRAQFVVWDGADIRNTTLTHDFQPPLRSDSSFEGRVLLDWTMPPGGEIFPALHAP